MIDQIWVAIALMKAAARVEMLEHENAALRAENENLKVASKAPEPLHAVPQQEESKDA
jgi:hypothetical protein